MKSRAAASDSSIGLRIRGGEFQHRLRADGAHPGLGGGFGDIFFKVIHIGEAGDAAADHLGAGQQRAQADKIG